MIWTHYLLKPAHHASSMSDSRFVELIRQMRIGVSSEAAAELFTMLDLQFFGIWGCDVMVSTFEPGSGGHFCACEFWGSASLIFFVISLWKRYSRHFMTFPSKTIRVEAIDVQMLSNVRVPWSLEGHGLQWLCGWRWISAKCFSRRVSPIKFRLQKVIILKTSLSCDFCSFSFGPQLSFGCCRVAGKSGTDGLGDECSQC